MSSSQPRKRNGQFAPKEIEKRRADARNLHGYNDLKDHDDYVQEMLHTLEKARLMKSNTKITPLGFTEEFLQFLGFNKQAANYKHTLPDQYLSNLTGDAAKYFTPVDDFYSDLGEGGDTLYDYSRVPLSYLMVLASQRLGICFRACNGTAGDVFRNKFDFVERDNDEKVVEKPFIKNYMDESKLWDKLVDMLDFDHRSGLGHLVPRYKGDKLDNLKEEAPNERPYKFESFSAYYMTPINIWEETTLLDYDKSTWTFLGGVVRPAQIHSSRVYTLEMRRVEGGLRGLALSEVAWTPLMCYLNTMYYILKGLSKLGVVMGQFILDTEYPTPAITQKYIDLWGSMVAGECIVLGKNATFSLVDSSIKIGSGIKNYLEFLIEDVSSAWIYPKNQLLGRSQGGGLDGAGALVSKEDYLGSNISVKQLQITNDVMYILKEICKFEDELEGLTIRWNIDLHKTEKTRLEEQLLREQVEVAKINTEQVKLQHKLYKRQIKLQTMMSDVQLKMMQQNPQQFMQQSTKDEENLEEKEKPQKDFIEDIEFIKLKKTLDILKYEYNMNNDLLQRLDQE